MKRWWVEKELGVGYNWGMRGKGFCRAGKRARGAGKKISTVVLGIFLLLALVDAKDNCCGDTWLRASGGKVKLIRIDFDNVKELPAIDRSGGVISEDADYDDLKKIKLSKKEFDQLWNQIISEHKKLVFNNEEEWFKKANVNGVEGVAVNMAKFSEEARKKIRYYMGKEEFRWGEWTLHGNPLDTKPKTALRIDNTEWFLTGGLGSVTLLRDIDGTIYKIGHAAFGPYTVLRGLRDNKFDLYVFGKHIQDFGGYNLNFAVLRLKDAYKYGFTGSQERYDLWIGWDNASLHVWFEVPKGYEVVGLMPSISKFTEKDKDGEIVNIYVRGMYLALKEKKENGKELLIYVGVAEDNLGITVSFQLAYK